MAKLSGFVNVTPSDVDAFKVALTQHGPLSVAIDASHLSFSFYASGVYYEPTCGSALDSMLIVLTLLQWLQFLYYFKHSHTYIFMYMMYLLLQIWTTRCWQWDTAL